MSPLLAPRLAWYLLRRNRGRLVVIIACVALAVALRSALGGALASIEAGVDAESRGLLGADLQIASNDPLPLEKQEQLPSLLPANTSHTQVIQLTTMASSPLAPGARPAALKAIESAWPLVGTMGISPAQGSVQFLQALKQKTFAENAVVPVVARRDLLLQLGINVGDPLRLGNLTTTIVGVLEDEPGLRAGFRMGPTVLLPAAALPATELIKPGSRVRYLQQYLLPDAASGDATAAAVREAWGLEQDRNGTMGRRIDDSSGIGVASAKESQTAVRRFLNRFGDILRLVALGVSLLAALGVGSLLRSVLLDGRQDSAVLQVTGLTPRGQIAVGCYQALWVALLGAAIGVIAGGIGAIALGQAAAARIDLPLAWTTALAPTQLIWASVIGICTAVLVALPTVWAVAGMPPASILRDNAAPPTTRRRSSVLWSLLGLSLITTLAITEARSWQLGGAMVAGCVMAGLVAWCVSVASLPILATLAKQPRWLPSTVARLAARNLARDDGRPTAALISMVLAIFLQSTLLIHSASFSAALQENLGGTAPSLFAIDIQPWQEDAVRDVLREQDIDGDQWAAVVAARLTKINGVTPSADSGGERERERARFFQGREQNLSWRPATGPGETLLEGVFPGKNGEQLVSLEETMAENIGATIGDTLTFSISGVEREFRVGSLRKVDWLGFNLNFFMLVTPGSLDDAPRMSICTIPPLSIEQRSTLQRRLAEVAPNVTTIDVADTVQQASSIFTTLLHVVHILAAFGAAAALAVLAGMALASGDRRRQEAALWRALGADDRQLDGMLLLEYSLLGCMAVFLGVGGGAIAATIGLPALLELPATLPWLWLAGLAVASVIATVLCGWLSCRRAQKAPPLQLLGSA